MTLPDTRAARASILGALRAAAPAAPFSPPELGPYGVGSQGERIAPASLVNRFEAAARGWRADVLRAGAHDWPEAVSACGGAVMVSSLYAGLPAAFRALAPERDMPSNLLLVTGPSKTADIQQTLAFGAHGPKELVIVMVHDRQGGAGDTA